MIGWHGRYRKIIDIYRGKLMEVDPAACTSADIKAEALGEFWVTDEGDLPPLDELWSAAQIARKWGFNRWDIANWVKAGKIERHDTPDGPKYRVRDVLAYFANKNKKS